MVNRQHGEKPLYYTRESGDDAENAQVAIEPKDDKQGKDDDKQGKDHDKEWK